MTSVTLDSPVDLSLLLFPNKEVSVSTLWADNHQKPYLSTIRYDNFI